MFGFLVGLIAGGTTPFAAPHIRKALENILTQDVTMSDAEFGTFCYAVMLILGGILVLFAGSGTPLPMALGGFLGMFGKRIYNTVSKKGGPAL